LDEESACAVLATVSPGPLDENVRARIIEETHGNPLALLELGRSSRASELLGGFAPPEALPRRIEDEYVERLHHLPIETRRWMLLAAAEPLGDTPLLLRAAQVLGLDLGSVKLATDTGLLNIGEHVRFRHPLVRSAVYRSASAEDRRAAHGALAAATDPAVDPDRRAWHGAQAASGPDEAVATDLINCASRAESRGGVAAAAAFWEKAVSLTPDPSQQASRALVAAEAKYAAADFEAAQALLAVADIGPVSELDHAHVQRMRAQITFALRRGRDAPPLLLRAAQRLQTLDADLARQTYLEAIVAAIYAGRLAYEGDVEEISLQAKTAPLGPEPLAHSDLLVRGLAVRMSDGYAAAAPGLRKALRDYRAQPEELDWLCVSYNLIAMDQWNDEAWFELAVGQVRLARASGTLSWLPFALDYLAEYHIQAGDLSQAAALLAEREQIDPGIRAATLPYVPLLLAAWRGEASTVTELTRVMARGASARGEGAALAYAEYAQAVLYNGLGDYGRAADAARAATVVDELVISPWSLYELVEAAARSGQPQQATGALRQLSDMAQASGSDWALGIVASSKALLSQGQGAESWYREALDRLRRTRVRTALARAHLLYGEWLRRENRRLDARDQLRTAHKMMTTMGTQGFAERARHELLATGETVRKRTVETSDDLTPQEAQIAGLAADRRTNAEIAAQLFISTRTVEWHLRKIFTKLGVSSRKDLRGALPDHSRMAPRP
jgi:DNA-binding CsgD family transcriptional regulator